MSEPLRGIVVSHSAVAQSLVAAVAAIAGVEDALLPVSNEGCDERALADRLTAAIGGEPGERCGDRPRGTCLTRAGRDARGKAEPAAGNGGDRAVVVGLAFHRT